LAQLIQEVRGGGRASHWVVWLPSIVVTVIGYYRVVSSWWFHDDWVFLANAAGVAARDSSLVRFVVYDIYWPLMYAMWGLNPTPYGISRLVVHVLCAVLVIRLARSLGLGRASQALSGAVFVSSPVAFESLFWGTGITEQFGTLFGLAAIAALLGSGRLRFVLSFLLVVLSLFSKESGYFLPFLWGIISLRQGMSRGRVLAASGLLATALVVAVLLIRSDLAASGDYPLSLASIPRNLMVYGFWLVSPPQFMRGLELGSSAIALMGASLWALWALIAIREHKRGNSIVFVLLVFCILPALPATLLGDHAVPRYLYSSVPALALSVGLIGSKFMDKASILHVVPLVLLLAFYSQTATAYRLDARWPSGVPIHRLVAKEALSRRVFEILESAGPSQLQKVVFLDPLPQSNIPADLLMAAVGSDLGVKLVLGRGYTAEFRTSVAPSDRGATIIKVESLGKVSYGTF
jgi:hypothetical protein